MGLAETVAGVALEDRVANEKLFAHRFHVRVKGYEGKRVMGPNHLLSADTKWPWSTLHAASSAGARSSGAGTSC